MDATFLKAATGLIPADDPTREWFTKVKLSGMVFAKVAQPPRWLFNYGFDYWAESAEPKVYKGQPVQPNFDRFRKDITILAGYYHPVFNIKGEIRMEADSISYAAMDETRFEQLYSKVIDVLLKKVFSRRGIGGVAWTEEKLRGVVDGLLEFV